MAADVLQYNDQCILNANNSKLIKTSSQIVALSDRLKNIINDIWSTERLVAEKSHNVIPNISQYKPLLHNSITVKKNKEINEKTMENTYIQFMNYLSVLLFILETTSKIRRYN